MVAQKTKSSKLFDGTDARPVPIDRDRSVAGLLEKMEGAGFSAKHLAGHTAFGSICWTTTRPSIFAVQGN
ncbi:MAG: hypothetical protein IPJ55_17710 [Chloracidobacterium sp.]|nr:hypothetical protein [Chloracidobacterium sp.]